MSLRITVLLVCLALVIGGAELLNQSSQMPEWTDPNGAMQVMTWDPPEEMRGPGFDAYYKRWVRAMKEYRTEKWPYHDAGAAFVAFAVSLAGAMFLFRVRTGDDVMRLQSPRRRWEVWLLASAGWLGYMGSVLITWFVGFDRWEFPPWADTLMIPIIWLGILTAFGWVILSFVIWLALRHARLPANLWVWRKDLPLHTGLSAVGAGFSILLALDLLAQTYMYGHWLAVPALLVWIYATLALRAAAVSREGL